MQTPWPGAHRPRTRKIRRIREGPAGEVHIFGSSVRDPENRGGWIAGSQRESRPDEVLVRAGTAASGPGSQLTAYQLNSAFRRNTRGFMYPVVPGQDPEGVAPGAVGTNVWLNPSVTLLFSRL